MGRCYVLWKGANIYEENQHNVHLPEKVPPWNMAPIRGVMKSLTNALTRLVKAVPITTATANSTTLPRKMKSRKPADHEGLVTQRLLRGADFFQYDCLACV